MSTHAEPTHPVVVVYSLIVLISELIGAIYLSITADDFRGWTAWMAVMIGLLINFLVNRERLEASIGKLYRETMAAIKEFFGR